MSLTTPTTAKGWQPGNPVGLREALEANSPWGYAATNGVKTAEFCPLCYALVPYDDDHLPKQVHIDYHVALAQSIEPVQ